MRVAAEATRRLHRMQPADDAMLRFAHHRARSNCLSISIPQLQFSAAADAGRVRIKV